MTAQQLQSALLFLILVSTHQIQFLSNPSSHIDGSVVWGLFGKIVIVLCWFLWCIEEIIEVLPSLYMDDGVHLLW